MLTTCGIYLLDKYNNLLICRATGGNNWSIPKGLQDPEEHYFTTAIRELQEETGIEYFGVDYIKAEILPDSVYKNGKKILKSLVLFTRNLPEDFDLKCVSNFKSKSGELLPEICEYRWVTLDEAPNYIHESQIANLEIIKMQIKFEKPWNKILLNSTYGSKL